MKRSQRPGDGVARGLQARGEEHAELPRQQRVGERLPGGRVPQAQQVRGDANVVRAQLPSSLHLHTQARLHSVWASTLVSAPMLEACCHDVRSSGMD